VEDMVLRFVKVVRLQPSGMGEGFGDVRGMRKVLWQHGEEGDEGGIWFGESGGFNLRAWGKVLVTSEA